MRLIQVAVPVPALDALDLLACPMKCRSPRPGRECWCRSASARSRASSCRDARMRGCGTRGRGSDPGSRIPDPGEVKPIAEVLDSEAFLPPDVLRLIAWVADYYACGIGEAMAAAMPPRAFVESERFARITEAGHARLLTERGARRKVLDALEEAGAVRIDPGAMPADRAAGARARRT